MSEDTNSLIELVRAIVEPLIEDKEALDLSLVDYDGTDAIEIRVAPDDAGKVIGRQGRIIKSIRVLARAAASQNGGDVEVELIED